MADGLLLEHPHLKVQQRITEDKITVAMVPEEEIRTALIDLFELEGHPVEPSRLGGLVGEQQDRRSPQQDRRADLETARVHDPADEDRARRQRSEETDEEESRRARGARQRDGRRDERGADQRAEHTHEFDHTR